MGRRKGRIRSYTALSDRNGFLERARFDEHETQIVQKLAIVRMAGQLVFVGAPSLRVVALVKIGIAEPVMAGGHGRIEADGLLEPMACGLEAQQRAHRIAEIVSRQGIGFECHRRVVGVDRFLDHFLRKVAVAQVVEGRSAGTERDRRTVGRDRLVVAAYELQCQTQGDPDRRILRAEIGSAQVMRDRVVVPVFASAQVSELELGLHVVGLELPAGLEVSARCGQVAPTHLGGRELAARVRIVRRPIHAFAKAADCLVGLTERRVHLGQVAPYLRRARVEVGGTADMVSRGLRLAPLDQHPPQGMVSFRVVGVEPECLNKGGLRGGVAVERIENEAAADVNTCQHGVRGRGGLVVGERLVELAPRDVKMAQVCVRRGQARVDLEGPPIVAFGLGIAMLRQTQVPEVGPPGIVVGGEVDDAAITGVRLVEALSGDGDRAEVGQSTDMIRSIRQDLAIKRGRGTGPAGLVMPHRGSEGGFDGGHSSVRPPFLQRCG